MKAKVAEKNSLIMLYCNQEERERKIPLTFLKAQFKADKVCHYAKYVNLETESVS